MWERRPQVEGSEVRGSEGGGVEEAEVGGWGREEVEWEASSGIFFLRRRAGGREGREPVDWESGTGGGWEVDAGRRGVEEEMEVEVGVEVEEGARCVRERAADVLGSIS